MPERGITLPATHRFVRCATSRSSAASSKPHPACYEKESACRPTAPRLPARRAYPQGLPEPSLSRRVFCAHSSLSASEVCCVSQRATAFFRTRRLPSSRASLAAHRSAGVLVSKLTKTGSNHRR